MRGLLIASALIGAGEGVAAFSAIILGCMICCDKFEDYDEEPTSHKVVTVSSVISILHTQSTNLLYFADTQAVGQVRMWQPSSLSS